MHKNVLNKKSVGTGLVESKPNFMPSAFLDSGYCLLVPCISLMPTHATKVPQNRRIEKI